MSIERVLLFGLIGWLMASVILLGFDLR